MTRLLFPSTFLLGAIATGWMAFSFIGANPLALVVTLVIGCGYIIGFIELRQFRAATGSLARALASPPTHDTADPEKLDDWLAKLHPSLQNAVRLRIEGERVGLPAPVLSPYLVGLLVMLGLLGTFVGMVDTLGGAAAALQGSTELEAIRAGLAAPIKGLELAFGTSVAGIASSAMLGLASTLSRRDRMQETRALDSKISSVFRLYSLSHNRQQTYHALQQQARALPEVAAHLSSLAQGLEQMTTRLSDRLLANQQQFHSEVTAEYSKLAKSVDQSLQESLAKSAQTASENITPVIEQTMAVVSEEARKTQQQLAATNQQQLDTMAGQFNATTGDIAGQFKQSSGDILAEFKRTMQDNAEQQTSSDRQRMDSWNQTLQTAGQQLGEELQASARLITETTATSGRQAAQSATAVLAEMQQLLVGAEQLLAARTESEGNWLAAHQQRMEAIENSLGKQLSELREQEANRSQAALEQLALLEQRVGEHLETLGRGLEKPIKQLIETASEAPKAAAELIIHLKKEISHNAERDNQLLEERRISAEQLNTLSTSLEQTVDAQRQAVEQLVSSSTTLLEDVSQRFAERLDKEVSQLNGAGEQILVSSAEMASLGDAFNAAVQLFNEANGQMLGQLASIETAMATANSRSDEQMNYYVSQARELIDHSLMSQKEIFEELRQLGQQQSKKSSGRE
jgi:hypothetical protein